MATQPVVQKAKLKMALSGLSVPQFMVRCGAIVESVNVNVAVFATPNPPIADLEDSLSNLGDRQMAVENVGGKDNTVLRNEARAILFDQMRTLAIYVAGVANGSAEIILLSGFDIVGGKSSVGILTAPQKLKVICDGLNTGELRASWTGVNGSKGFMAQLSLVTNETGIVVKTVKAKGLRHLFTDLTGSAQYSLRIATLSSAGQGPWGNPVAHRPQ